MVVFALCSGTDSSVDMRPEVTIESVSDEAAVASWPRAAGAAASWFEGLVSCTADRRVPFHPSFIEA